MNTTPIVIEQSYRATSSVKSSYSAGTLKNNHKNSIKEALQHGISLLRNARKKSHATHKELFR
ncbi:MAG: hypothetical protein HYV32_02580 [Candidatus Kerfeldbacteria bacterium]|nr:hypothetical protein [Candidatus Kerfeldbacteria bacterium]